MRTDLLLTAVVFALVAVLTACAAETPEVSYENMDAAIQDGSVERGWIPEWLPSAAFDIHEKHNIDTNAQILRFAVNSWGKEHVPDRCQPVEAVRPPTLKAKWWSDSTVESAPNLYACGSSFLAFDDDQIYFWQP